MHSSMSVQYGRSAETTHWSPAEIWLVFWKSCSPMQWLWPNLKSQSTWKAILIGGTTLNGLPTLLPGHTQPAAAGGIPKQTLIILKSSNFEISSPEIIYKIAPSPIISNMMIFMPKFCHQALSVVWKGRNREPTAKKRGLRIYICQWYLSTIFEEI